MVFPIKKNALSCAGNPGQKSFWGAMKSFWGAIESF
jgi:hypothetical protein